MTNWNKLHEKSYCSNDSACVIGMVKLFFGWKLHCCIDDDPPTCEELKQQSTFLQWPKVDSENHNSTRCRLRNISLVTRDQTHMFDLQQGHRSNKKLQCENSASSITKTWNRFSEWCLSNQSAAPLCELPTEQERSTIAFLWWFLV